MICDIIPQGRQEERKAGRQEGRQAGRKEGRIEGRKEGRRKRPFSGVGLPTPR